MKPVFGGFETGLKFIKFRHRKDLSCKFNFESVVGSAVTHKFIVKIYKEGEVAEGRVIFGVILTLTVMIMFLSSGNGFMYITKAPSEFSLYHRIPGSVQRYVCRFLHT